MTEQILALGSYVVSMASTVVIFAGIGLGAAWFLERNAPCNPYGIGSCSCSPDKE